LSARLEPLPDSFAATRRELHRVAEEIVAPARKPHNEIALRATPGGFGTPPFEHSGARIQVRVDGADLVVERDGEEDRAPLTTLADAAGRVGAALLPDGVPDDAAQLGVDAESAQRLGAFYEFADDLLGRFRSMLPADAHASEVTLWPEHFDLALEAGSEDEGARANYGASPGDDEHPEPYVYVGPWTAPTDGELWNATAFDGAELGYSELLASDDQLATALEFLEQRFRALK
jgi:hypothetical protein